MALITFSSPMHKDKTVYAVAGSPLAFAYRGNTRLGALDLNLGLDYLHNLPGGDNGKDDSFRNTRSTCKKRKHCQLATGSYLFTELKAGRRPLCLQPRKTTCFPAICYLPSTPGWPDVPTRPCCPP